MSFASDLIKKMIENGQLKPKPKPLPSSGEGEIEQPKPVSQEKPGQPGGDQAESATKTPVKIFSKLFNEEIWLCANKEEMDSLVARGVKEAVYMAWEIPILRGKDKDALKAVHEAKKVFPGSGLA